MAFPALVGLMHGFHLWRGERLLPALGAAAVAVALVVGLATRKLWPQPGPGELVDRRPFFARFSDLAHRFGRLSAASIQVGGRLVTGLEANTSSNASLNTSPNTSKNATHWPRRSLMIACFIWGFAEATLFFIVPDVLLTFLALKSRRLAMWGCVAATLGALVGGALMLSWSMADRAAAIAAVDRVPFVPAAMVESVQNDLRERGAVAVLMGPWTGKPYKLYAVQAPAAGMSLGAFLAVSIPARILRFLFLSLAARAAALIVDPRWGWRTTLAIWSLAWVGNYAVYWSLMSQ